MGVSINNVSVAELKDGIDLLLESEKREASGLPVAVRTDKGVEGHFYLDIEDGRFLISPESFYANAKARCRAKNSAAGSALSATERRRLADLLDALIGVASERGTEFFRSYHKRGGSAMLSELEAILRKHAPAELAAVVG